MTTTQKRNRYVLDRADVAAGLRAYADLLDNDPSVPISANLSLGLFVHAGEDVDEKQVTRQLLRTLGGGHWDKGAYDNYLIFRGWLHGVPVDVWVSRQAVCERVVTGTREVTELLPVGEDTRPVQPITRTVEDVQWICSPLLADEQSAVSA